MTTIAHITNSDGMTETRTYNHTISGQYRALLGLVHNILDGTMPGDSITIKQMEI